VILILATAPIFNASGQYVKLLKGQPNPFDTAVAIRIDKYRQEGLKLKLGQQLVDSLISEIGSLYHEIRIGDSINAINQQSIYILTKANVRKDSVNGVLYNSFNEVHDIAISQNKWYRRPETVLAAVIIFELLKLFLK
jgi:hypothetical protein